MAGPVGLPVIDTMIGVSEGSAAELALTMFPDRFIAPGNVADPNEIIDYANTRGAAKIIYAG
ncbi:hypothetical protein MSAR_14680 [Mycolicibacterium sarraceniae]|uniref:Uncharacterized protein n=1 Tax=Mycolicibacterium sarraceniae TaxID=1534348 RepID=A0A7I7SN02_9MYCO|nr:hypothetical protein [Mycolicibacterium sarraceniae]BBY58332.1 hypothetical protein MSAR_14680 [Mycolicibacterium sarraceniae]